MDRGDITRQVTFLPSGFKVARHVGDTHSISSSNCNSRWRTSWYQSAAVVLVFIVTVADREPLGSPDSTWPSGSPDERTTRGGGTAELEVKGTALGSGYILSVTLNSVSNHGSKAPSILNQNHTISPIMVQHEKSSPQRILFISLSALTHLSSAQTYQPFR